MVEVASPSRLYEDLTPPIVVGDVNPNVFDELLGKFPACEFRAVHIGHAGIPRPLGNDQLLDALGDYKDMVVAYAEAARCRRVKAVRYIIDMNVVMPGHQQRPGRWHVDGMQGGMAILASSAVPTEFIVGTPDIMGEEDRYFIEDGKGSYQGDVAYDDTAIQTGIETGKLLVHQPENGQAVELGSRVHRSAKNTTGNAMRKAFITALIDFKKPSVFKNLLR